MYGALDCIFFPFLLYLSYIFFFFFFFSSRRRHTRCLSDWSSDVCSSDLITLTNGTWSGDVAALRADETNINRGNVNFYAWLQSAPAKNGTSDPFVVHPGALARVQIVVPGETVLPGSPSGKTGSPASQSAGRAFQVNVWSTDSYWNPV